MGQQYGQWRSEPLDPGPGEDQSQSEGKQGQAMADVAEHDPEEEREGDCSEESRIGLAVLSHPICLDNFLCRYSVAVNLEECGLLLAPGVCFVQRNQVSRWLSGLLFILTQFSLQLLDVCSLKVDLRLQEVIEHLHFIQLAEYLQLFN